MTQSNLQSRQLEKGFTLVELAIVMIIIGLLIGGILKGQELINNARVSSTVSQVKAVETGISGFRDKFGGMPGDLTAPADRIPNCANQCNFAGDGNGNVETGTAGDAGGVATVGTNEAGSAFIQLGAAGFLGGVNGAAAAAGAGASHPNSPISGVWNFGYSDGATATTGLESGLTFLPRGHYIFAAVNPEDAGDAGAPLLPGQAANIDRKVDDGLPNSGTVQAAAANAGDCASADDDTGIYIESAEGALCSVFAKVQ